MEVRTGKNETDGPASAGDPDAVRYRTLLELEKLLRLLTDRHGARTTLGEMLAVITGMTLLCKKDRVSIAEISEATGLPKQNLSRWARKRIGESLSLRVNDDDQRMHDLIMLDANRGQEHIERLAEIFGTDRSD